MAPPEPMPVMPEAEEEEPDPAQTGDQVLFGRVIRGRINEMDELEDGKRMILHGIVSAKSERQIKGEKMLVQYTLTDYKKEAIVKAFVPEAEYGTWSDKVKNGVTIMAKGTAKQDDYLHAVTSGRQPHYALRGAVSGRSGASGSDESDDGRNAV